MSRQYRKRSCKRLYDPDPSVITMILMLVFVYAGHAGRQAVRD